MAYEAWVRPDALMHGRQTALEGSLMPAEHTIRNLFQSIYGRNERAATFREFQKYFRKGYRGAIKQKGKANPALHAQVRRLPTGEVQLKIPLTRNPASLKSAMKYVRKLGRRVKSVVVTGVKRAKRNPAGAYWQQPWVVQVRSESTGEATAGLSAGFSTEKLAKAYIRGLRSRGLSAGRVVDLVHNIGNRAVIVSTKVY